MRPPSPKYTAEDPRMVSGQRPKFAQRDPATGGYADHEKAVDPLLESAEREGRLLAWIAQRDRELECLRGRVDRLEISLATALEHLALASIHEARTIPPSPPAAPSDRPRDVDPT